MRLSATAMSARARAAGCLGVARGAQGAAAAGVVGAAARATTAVLPSETSTDGACGRIFFPRILWGGGIGDVDLGVIEDGGLV